MCAAGFCFATEIPKDAVTGGDIQDFVCRAALAEFGSHDFGGHMHQRHHGLRKLHPVGIFGLQRSFAQRGASPAHGLGQPRVTFEQAGREQKLNGGADICWRMPVEE